MPGDEKMTKAAAPAESTVTYEQLADLETDFDDVDLQLLIHQEHLSRPLYAKRAALIAQIPHFWALVLEQAPPDLDPYIQPSDSRVIAECLVGLDVERFEVRKAEKEEAGGKNSPSDGSSRSLKFRFDFSANEWFEDRVLEKKFWFRRAGKHGKRGDGGWTALVSEPVKIHWKKGKDLTDGLTDAAVAYWDAKQKIESHESSENDEKQKEEKMKELPEYKALVKKVGSSDEGSLSFFAWFGFTAGRRYISAEESAAANKAVAERRERRTRRMDEKESEKRNDVSDSNEIDEDDDEGSDDEEEEGYEEDISESAQDTEIFPNGEELATLLAEEIWPQAIKYFTEAQELDDQDLSDMEMEMDMEENEDEDGDNNQTSSSSSSSSSPSSSSTSARKEGGKNKQNRDKEKKKRKKKNKIDIRSLVTDQQTKRKAGAASGMICDDDSESLSSSSMKKQKKK